MTSGPVEVLSDSSHSRLAELYKTQEFATEWANDVPFHVARNILHLRRYRNLSQSQLAKAMGTSQSAIARMENGHENITLDTLQRLTFALGGRFYMSITPQEFPIQHHRPWWEVQSVKTPWMICGWVSMPSAESDRLIIGLERVNEAASTVLQLLPQTASTGGL